MVRSEPFLWAITCQCSETESHSELIGVIKLGTISSSSRSSGVHTHKLNILLAIPQVAS